MRIIDIKDNARLQVAALNFRFCISVLISVFLLLPFLSGCVQTSELKKAQGYFQQSQTYYQQAVNLYKDLIAKGKDLDRLHFELGQLYYHQGEWKEAIEEFKKTKYLKAQKFLAISYYYLGNFTDAF